MRVLERGYCRMKYICRTSQKGRGKLLSWCQNVPSRSRNSYLTGSLGEGARKPLVRSGVLQTKGVSLPRFVAIFVLLVTALAKLAHEGVELSKD